MDIYSDFAWIYDFCMDNIPYDEWVTFILKQLSKSVAKGAIVCELGCGTGEITFRLADAGYDMIGVDFSEDMLLNAREKAEDRNSSERILFLHQDMRELELFGTVGAVVSVCDSLNYITEEKDLLEVFKKVNNYLEKDGVFLFDVKTEVFYRDVAGDEVRVEHFDDGMLIWENAYDEESHLNEYDLTIFTQEEDSDLFAKSTEEHVQRAYPLSTLKALLEEAGLEFVAAFDDYSESEAKENSQRFVILAKEGFQSGKKYS